jgi:hypothetical protein
MRDMVHVHVTADVPLRAQALPYADRIEVRFGKAFPVALIIDHNAVDRLGDALRDAKAELDAAARRKGGDR